MQRIRVRAVIEHQGRFLLVRNASSGDLWCLPGGGVESGEDIISALSRELAEELQVQPVVGPLLYVHQFQIESDYQAPEFFFRVENGADYVQVPEKVDTGHGSELLAVAWHDIRQVSVRPAFLASELPGMDERSQQSGAVRFS